MPSWVQVVGMWYASGIQQSILLASLFLCDDRVGLPGHQINVLVLPFSLYTVRVQFRW